MLCIGLAGQAQAGKNETAKYLIPKLNERTGKNWKEAAFAKSVKQIYADTFGVSFDFIEEWKVKPEVPPGFDMPVRQGLQFIGDGLRKIRSTIWIDLLFRSNDPIVITDVRYPNEFKRVKKEGGVNILIGRPEMMNNDPNGSETLIRPYVDWALKNWTERFWFGGYHLEKEGTDTKPVDMDCFDYFIRNDGTKDQLYQHIDDIIECLSKEYLKGVK